jgi:hypothetical protein
MERARRFALSVLVFGICCIEFPDSASTDDYGSLMPGPEGSPVPVEEYAKGELTRAFDDLDGTSLASVLQSLGLSTAVLRKSLAGVRFRYAAAPSSERSIKQRWADPGTWKMAPTGAYAEYIPGRSGATIVIYSPFLQLGAIDRLSTLVHELVLHHVLGLSDNDAFLLLEPFGLHRTNSGTAELSTFLRDRFAMAPGECPEVE